MAGNTVHVMARRFWSNGAGVLAVAAVDELVRCLGTKQVLGNIS